MIIKTKHHFDYIISFGLSLIIAVLFFASTVVYLNSKEKTRYITDSNIDYVYELTDLTDLVAAELDVHTEQISVINPSEAAIGGDGKIQSFFFNIVINKGETSLHYIIYKQDSIFSIFYGGKLGDGERLRFHANKTLHESLSAIIQIQYDSYYNLYDLEIDCNVVLSIEPGENSYLFDGSKYNVVNEKLLEIRVAKITCTPSKDGIWVTEQQALYFFGR